MATEAPVAVPVIKNYKSPAQLAMLAQARIRAMEVRKENSNIRNKEKEIKQVEDVKRKIEIETKHSELYKVPTPQVTETQEPVDTEVVKKKPKKKVVVISDSDSDDDYTTIRVKKTKLAKWQTRPPTAPISVPAALAAPVPQPRMYMPKAKNPLFSMS